MTQIQNTMNIATVPSRKLEKEWRKTLRRFCRNKLSVTGGIVLLFIILISALAPLIAPYDPMKIDMMNLQNPPSAQHLLGTDTIGRDVLSRLLYAGRVSMSVGILAVAIYMVVGIILGAVAGYSGGIVDMVIMRLADAVMSFPLLPLIIVMVAIMGTGITNIVLVISIVGWPQVARLVRGEVLTLKSREFIEAARASGESTMSIILTQLIPNCVAPIIVAGTFGVAQAILMEASLSFLGLGIQPPQASWGYMLMDAQSITILSKMPWLWLPPGLVIFISVMSINFIGDGLRDALDPKMKR